MKRLVKFDIEILQKEWGKSPLFFCLFGGGLDI